MLRPKLQLTFSEKAEPELLKLKKSERKLKAKHQQSQTLTKKLKRVQHYKKAKHSKKIV